MAVFFTSDTHFGDQRVIFMYQRPFATTAEMDAVREIRESRKIDMHFTGGNHI